MTEDILSDRAITIIAGVSCSGKEFVSNKIRGNYDLSFGAEAFNKDKKGYLKQILKHFDSVICKNILCEGYPFWSKESMSELHKRFKTVNLILAIAPYNILVERQLWQGTNIASKKDIMYFYKLAYELFEGCSVSYYDTSKAYAELELSSSFEELEVVWKHINREPTLDEELDFICTLPREGNMVLIPKPGEVQYNDIELPSGTYTGLINCNKTWENILSLEVMFKDKTVVDVGCNEGYYLFKAKEYHATRCIGFDISEKYIANGKTIAFLKSCPVDFIQSDISTTEVPLKRDITICMNMIHYTKVDRALEHIFSDTNEAIFQCDKGVLFDKAKYVASKHGLEVVTYMDDRPNRVLVHFSKPESQKVRQENSKSI